MADNIKFNYTEYLNDVLVTIQWMVQHKKEHYKNMKARPTDSTDSENPRSTPVFSDEVITSEEHDNGIRLYASLKNQFEILFGANFSGVVIHTGRYANELTRATNADAVTIGSHIYFSDGKYAPDTEDGMRLLAHELQHVVQNIRGDRHAYREDIAQAEQAANRAENEISLELLFGESAAAPDVARTPHPGGHTPIPFPNAAKTADLSNQNKEVVLEKSQASTDQGTGDNADAAFQTQRSGAVFQLKLKDGSSIDLSKGEMASLYKAFEDRVSEYLSESRHLMDSPDYEKMMMKFSGLVRD